MSLSVSGLNQKPGFGRRLEENASFIVLFCVKSGCQNLLEIHLRMILYLHINLNKY